MTTDIDTGEQIPPCKEHTWLYMKTLKHKDGRECYMVYCPKCWQKSAHIPDFSEEEFLDQVFKNYDKSNMRRSKKPEDEQNKNGA
jgi:hypothetical protein